MKNRLTNQDCLMPRSFLVGLLLAAAGPAVSALAQTTAAPAAVRSAPITNIRYELTFDSTTAVTRTLKVGMTFDLSGTGPVLLSIPAWTPGAYEISNFARKVSNFEATTGGREARWDKLDYDTYRIVPGSAKSMAVRFEFLADTLDNAMAWAQPDFLLVNGTNVFPYPEGQSLAFPATVVIRTQPGWLVATGMHRGPEPGTYRESNYHDLVDMPFFIGRIDLDSNQVAGRWTRLATYPSGRLTGTARAAFWDEIGKMIPAEAAVTGEVPWDDYSILDIFQDNYPGGSALEHQSSHVGIYATQFTGTPILASITAHEIFHAWNVKRLRPSDMVPYRYSQAQPTPWLWVSEGITDYYADLALVRSGIVEAEDFYETTTGKIDNVESTPPVALEDASLSTWIHPVDGSQYIYYAKGSLAGFLLDILIRDASNNRNSLDGVVRELYRTTYKAGRGFTAADWWQTVTRAAKGTSLADFNARYVDGREPYPWDRVLPLAGLKLQTDTVQEPRLGVQSASDSSGVRVLAVVPGSSAGDAGVRPGDLLVSLGDLVLGREDFGPEFRRRFATRQGQDLPIVVRRGDSTLTLAGKVRLVARTERHMVPDPQASAKAVGVREGILTGR